MSGSTLTGYRGEEMPAAPQPSTVRIACVGDSWTFGMPVAQDETYPEPPGGMASPGAARTRYEVQNFGVLGYSSFQGLQLLKTRVLAFHPNVVVIGFGMNDSEVAGYRDKDIVGGTGRPSFTSRLKEMAKDAASRIEGYKFLKFEALRLTFHPKPLGDYLKDGNRSQRLGRSRLRLHRAVDARVAARLRAEHSRDDSSWAGTGRLGHPCRQRALARESLPREVLRTIANELDAPLVDSLAIINGCAGRHRGESRDSPEPCGP